MCKNHEYKKHIKCIAGNWQVYFASTYGNTLASKRKYTENMKVGDNSPF
ncbi:hypothetical protein GCM10011409_01090 [Lentibacillus populi]|uniref:Uncharacterized protein n=1 Tax=Lentibacillus populi TaxID=1827502 RepID=A0A9W5TTM1_9BACI|nr:hypothetical protein GCM10011409_01090 [Lentibacillus populi]